MGGYARRLYGSTKGLVTEFVDRCGGAEPVRAFLDLDRANTVRAWTSPNGVDEISFARVRKLTEHFGVTLMAEALAADAGGYFVPPEPGDEDVSELMAKGETARGQFLADFLRRLDREGAANADADMRRHLDECLATLAAVRAKFRS